LFDLDVLAELMERNPEARVWVIIRHADRGPLLEAHEVTPLSPEGVSNSRRFGRRISERDLRVVCLWSSPLIRCVRTGENILSACGAVMPVERSEVLAYPGSLLVEDCTNDALKAARLSEGAYNVLRALVERGAPAGSIALFVTHDAIIMPVLSYLTGEEYDESDNVGFLDGFAIVLVDGEWLVLDPRGHCHDASRRMSVVLDGPGK